MLYTCDLLYSNYKLIKYILIILVILSNLENLLIYFNYFLDEKISLKLDRFDPGGLSESGSFSPCAVLPNDIVVPVSFRSQSKSGSAEFSVHNPTKEKYYQAFKASTMLGKQ